MRVGAYIDGFNLYKRAQEMAGDTAGWKWLDFRALVASLATEMWPNSAPHEIVRVVYCTSNIKPTVANPDGPGKQEMFIHALRESGSVDWVEYGLFIEKTKVRPLARRKKNGSPQLVHPAMPVYVKRLDESKVPDAVFYVSVADREEKGSDVNVATYLLLDVLADPRPINAAVVISNDSDLKVPVAEARKRLPVGIVNRGRGRTAGLLCHDPNDTALVGEQWERQLTFADLTAHQLPDPVGPYVKPDTW